MMSFQRGICTTSTALMPKWSTSATSRVGSETASRSSLRSVILSSLFVMPQSYPGWGAVSRTDDACIGEERGDLPCLDEPDHGLEVGDQLLRVVIHALILPTSP